jgi:uncharacterized spore protein YtfJ
VTQGDKTFLPVVSITIGYGSGNASMKGQSSGTSTTAGSSNSGTGALGLGAKLCTDAVIVIDSQNVFMLPVNSSAASGNLVDKIPQIISGMKNSGTANTGATNQTSSTNTSSQTQTTPYANSKQTQSGTKY